MSRLQTIDIEELREFLIKYVTGKNEIKLDSDDHDRMISKTLLRMGGLDVIQTLDNYLSKNRRGNNE